MSISKIDYLVPEVNCRVYRVPEIVMQEILYQLGAGSITDQSNLRHQLMQAIEEGKKFFQEQELSY